MNKADIVLGYGEIGRAVRLVSDFPVYAYDKSEGKFNIRNYPGKIRIMHVSFPYNDNFIKQVKNYQKILKPEYTVIHSTVPVGTSRKCNAIHSPVVGIHPHLAESLKTFTKFFGGESASEVADIFRKYGVKTYVVDKPETTELMKIQCTTLYGLNIEFFKDMKEQCEKYGVPFEAWTIWNDNYNKGYEKLGYPEYHRYNLVPLMKKIGGHCVVNNYFLLKTKFTEFLKKL
jgi:UDP-N-acetyl-D-mannosaminuronate dehydrogenase